jgi:separase
MFYNSPNLSKILRAFLKKLQEIDWLDCGTSKVCFHHTVLILDKHLYGLPWENIPTLRRRSVSRLPSLFALQNRLELLENDKFKVDSKRTFYILNPGGDLTATQARFEILLKEIRLGVVGEPPDDGQIRDGMENNDVFL